MNKKLYSKESASMRFFRRVGLDSIAWSLRRLYCPVNKKDLVLEVGSGGEPYFRSNILCDAYEVSEERFFAPLVHDRPTVISKVENLPFKNDSFDFVIASHVLEHSADPEKFLLEIQRVGKAGYIEVPDAFMERLTHYTFHRLEITEKKDKLIIRKKKNYIHDDEIVDLFKNKARPIFSKWASKYPFHFHVRYYWKKSEGGIKFKIINPDLKTDWNAPLLRNNYLKQKVPLLWFLKKKFLQFLRLFLSQNSRNRSINLKEMLLCPYCKKDKIKLSRKFVKCKLCNFKFKYFYPTHE